jgi:hypothetical protein
MAHEKGHMEGYLDHRTDLFADLQAALPQSWKWSEVESSYSPKVRTAIEDAWSLFFLRTAKTHALKADQAMQSYFKDHKWSVSASTTSYDYIATKN